MKKDPRQSVKSLTNRFIWAVVIFLLGFTVALITTISLKFAYFDVLWWKAYGWPLFFCLAVISVLVFHFLGKSEVNTLRNVAEKMADGQRGVRAEEKPLSFTYPIAKSFNLMAERVEDTLNEQENLLQTMAHEVRTPLARIRFIQAKLNTLSSLDELDEQTAALETELNELEQLVEDVLSGLQADSQREQRHAFDAFDVLDDLIERCYRERPELSIELVGFDEQLPQIHANPNEFKRVIRNLLSNALKHAEQKIRIKSVFFARHLSIEIEDDGPGIPPEKRSTLFQPFLSQSPHDSSSTGLGLTISNRICISYGSPIIAETSDLGGAKLMTRWPIET